MRQTKEQMEAEIQALRTALEMLESQKQELQQTNTALYRYCRKMDQQFSLSVKRELGYREMLFVLNPAQTKNLLQEYIGKSGLKVQYSAAYNYRCN